MGIAGARSARQRNRSTSLSWVQPFYGTGLVGAPLNEALVKSLQHRGDPGTLNFDFAIDANGMTTSMFYAYPKSFGQAEFVDAQNGFIGGWDGASSSGNGPTEVTVHIKGYAIDFYLYKTDWPNLGPASQNSWQVRPLV